MARDELEKLAERPTGDVEVTFRDRGDFVACRAAEKWLTERGFSVGIMQGPAPRGILHGDYLIAKWRNLNKDERDALDGEMTGSMRNGPVRVVIKARCAAALRARGRRG